MNNKPPIKIFYERILELKSSVSVSTSIKVFIFATIVVIAISLKYYDAEFAENLLVEAHGMLFDILVIGIFILSLNRLAEKRIENQRYLDEIDDFRGWNSKEAAYKIAGNIRRLNRNGFKGRINLHECYMHSVDLRKVTLIGANLEKTDLTNANLEGAYFRNANLRGAKLVKAKLDKASLMRTNLEEANLVEANLQGADLLKANLVNSNLKEAKLNNANLYGANLKGVDFQEADLNGVKTFLFIQQLAEVKSLYKAKLDPTLMKQVKEKCPHLLENPKVPNTRP